jgi:nucleoside-diphosphate-sugar epimerase
VVYLGGLVPATYAASAHLASRREVEETLLGAAPQALALRASIVVGARSRSFRFLVRLVERVPVMPLPAWRDNRTQPIDGRDVLAYLLAAATSPAVDGPLSLDIAGPDVVTYGELVARIRDALLVGRAPIRLGFSLTPVASRVAAAIAGEDHALIGPLMEGLEGDLLPRDMRAAELLGVRLHRLDAAIERALREWESVEELRAR